MNGQEDDDATHLSFEIAGLRLEADAHVETDPEDEADDVKTFDHPAQCPEQRRFWSCSSSSSSLSLSPSPFVFFCSHSACCQEQTW